MRVNVARLALPGQRLGEELVSYLAHSPIVYPRRRQSVQSMHFPSTGPTLPARTRTRSPVPTTSLKRRRRLAFHRASRCNIFDAVSPATPLQRRWLTADWGAKRSRHANATDNSPGFRRGSDSSFPRLALRPRKASIRALCLRIRGGAERWRVGVAPPAAPAARALETHAHAPGLSLRKRLFVKPVLGTGTCFVKARALRRRPTGCRVGPGGRTIRTRQTGTRPSHASLSESAPVPLCLAPLCLANHVDRSPPAGRKRARHPSRLAFLR